MVSFGGQQGMRLQQQMNLQDLNEALQNLTFVFNDVKWFGCLTWLSLLPADEHQDHHINTCVACGLDRTTLPLEGVVKTPNNNETQKDLDLLMGDILYELTWQISHHLLRLLHISTAQPDFWSINPYHRVLT